uniref:IRS-type PTB domain-containing protein n=1 Tax=Syphacia muris TaxID=451379 RepID=A0A0N5ABI7_9BILA
MYENNVDNSDDVPVKIASIKENMIEQDLTVLVKSVSIHRNDDDIEYYKCLISDGSGLAWFYASPKSCALLESRRINKGCVYRLCRVDAKRNANHLVLLSAAKSLVKQIQPLGRVFEVL